MSHAVFFLDKVIPGNPYHGRIEHRTSGEKVIILPDDSEVEIFGGAEGPLTWYFKHPDAVETATPANLVAQGYKFCADAIFCGETKVYSPSFQSGVNPVLLGDPDHWLRVCGDKKVRPAGFVFSSVTATGFTLTVSYSTTEWDPLSPTNHGTLTTKQVFNLTSTVPSGTAANPFAEVSDVSPDGGKALIVHGCQHSGSLDYSDTIVSCWELTLTDASVASEKIWSFEMPSETTETETAPSIEYVSRYTLHSTSGGTETWNLYETWTLDTGVWYIAEVASWLWLACYDKDGVRHLIEVGFNYRNYASRHLYTAKTATVVTDMNWAVGSSSGSYPPGISEPSWPASPILNPNSAAFNNVNCDISLIAEAYLSGDYNCVTDNGGVVLASDLGATKKIVSFGAVDKKTAHVMVAVRNAEGGSTVIDRFLVAPGVVDSAPLTGTIKATYDARNTAIISTTDSAISVIAVM